MLFNNHITLQIRRARIERRAAGAWALDVFRALCERTSPAWGAVHDSAEYRAKVMSDGPGVAAVGRDFARFLPGVFAGNFFGAPYVDLFGRDRLLDSPAADVAALGDGVLVVRGDGPDADDRLLDHLGREHFFARPHPPDPSRAPVWPG